MLLAKPPLTKPGTVYAYSNAGYVFAGLMAEEVTGQPWEELMQQRLFDPLKMKSAGFGPTGQSNSERIDQPWGHRENHGRFETGPARQRPVHGTGGHCPLFHSRLGQVCVSAPSRCPRKTSASQTIDVPDPAHAAAGK